MFDKLKKSISESSLFRNFYSRDVTYNNQYPTFTTNPNSSDNVLVSAYYRLMQFESTRRSLYKDYELMDSDIVAASLDLIADDSTQFDLEADTPFEISCDDPKIKKELEKLYFKTLNIEDHLWDIVRMFNKYGDFFVRVYGDKKDGIKFVDYSYHPIRFSKVVNKGVIKGFVLDQRKTLLPWEVVHFKLPGSAFRRDLNETQIDPSSDDDASSIDYGTSSLYRARKVWRQLSLVEDSILMSRLTRSIRRNIFQVNVDGLNEKMAQETIDNMAELLKKQRAFSNTNGMESLNSAVLASRDEDIIIPVNGNKGVLNVTPIGDGDSDINGTADLDYYTNKLFGALKTPKPFLGFEEALNGRNTLRMLDVRYARYIKVSQRALCLGLTRLGYIHLSLLTKDPLNVPFSIKLPYVSTIEEVERMEVYGLKVQALSDLTNLLTQLDPDLTAIPKENLIKYILKEELHWDDETIRKLFSTDTSSVVQKPTGSFAD